MRVEGLDKIYSLRARKRYGFSHSYGTAFFGYTVAGDYNPMAGIYYKHRAKGGMCISRAKFYWPTNRPHEKQEAWRGAFAAGMAEWKGLTSEEKSSYHKRAQKQGLAGFNLYLRRYLSTHST